MMSEKRVKGRPKKDSRYTKEIEFRGTKEHEQMLKELVSKGDKSRSEVLREALERYYELKVMDQMTYF